MNQYKYSPIQSGGSIRLFHLNPGTGADTVSGNLVHVSFTDVPQYEALSYTWGNPVMKHRIVAPGGIIRITASLKSALKRLRLPDQVRVLWIDALCINQQDNEEKSRQILLMPLIYSVATKVVAHLGDAADGSDTVLDFLHVLSNTDYGPDENNSVLMVSLVSLGLPPPGSSQWNAFRKFWCRPWFGRIWILQEFLLGKTVSLICGKWESPWEALFVAAVKINNYGLVIKSDPYGIFGDSTEINRAKSGVESMLYLGNHRKFSNTNRTTNGIKAFLQPTATGESLGESMNIPAFRAIAAIGGIVDIPSNTGNQAFIRTILNIRNEGDRTPVFLGMPLKILINHSLSCQATDPRDRFFALLGLANDINASDLEYLKPDYGKSLQWIACKYASLVVKKGQGMEILYNACPPPGESKFPTWLGHWASYNSGSSSFLAIGAHESGAYNAGGNTMKRMLVGKDSDTLGSCGSRLDTITLLGSGPILQPMTGALFPLVANANLREADRIFSTLTRYPTGEPLEEVKWRTLIANKTATTNELPKSNFGNQYKLWRGIIKGMFWAATPEDRMKMSPPPVLDYFQSLVSVNNYKLCITKTGLGGLVPAATQRGDSVVILLGGRVPFILRPSTIREGLFTMIGGCYIHGMMNGEALNLPGWKEEVIAMY